MKSSILGGFQNYGAEPKLFGKSWGDVKGIARDRQRWLLDVVDGLQSQYYI